MIISTFPFWRTHSLEYQVIYVSQYVSHLLIHLRLIYGPSIIWDVQFLALAHFTPRCDILALGLPLELKVELQGYEPKVFFAVLFEACNPITFLRKTNHFLPLSDSQMSFLQRHECLSNLVDWEVSLSLQKLLQVGFCQLDWIRQWRRQRTLVGALSSSSFLLPDQVVKLAVLILQDRVRVNAHAFSVLGAASCVNHLLIIVIKTAI